MSRFPRGSEWRKWDLHIHTPGTAKNDNYSGRQDIWKDYIEKLESCTDIAVLGITDYLSIENYIKVKNFQESGSLQDKLIVPNIELRILPVTNNDTPINLHVIFDPNVSVADIDREFFRKLIFKYKEATFSCTRNDLIALGRAYKKDQSLEETSAWKEGVGQFIVSYEEIRDILAGKFLQGKFIVSVSNKSTDGNSGIQESALRASRQEIYRMSDIIFSSNPNDVKYFLGQGCDAKSKVIADYGSLKPCIIGSDAHQLEDVCQFPNDRVTWIKADPTFEGLKQIVYEPEERVCIQHGKPEDKAGYHVIDSIVLREDGFWETEIPFNENLTVIIGGRSTGKSTLLESMARKISPEKVANQKESEEKDDFLSGHINGVSVIWKDKENSERRDVDYFSQNYMYEIARDDRRVNDLVESILKERDTNSVLASYKIECTTVRDSISAKCSNLFRLQSQITQLVEEAKTIGDKAGIEKEIDVIEKSLAALNSQSTLSEDERRAFDELKTKHQENKSEVERLNNDSTQIEQLQQKEVVNSAIAYEFSSFSAKTQALITRIFSFFSRKVAETWHNSLEKIRLRVQIKISSTQATISAIENNLLYIKGMAEVSNNFQYKQLQDRLTPEKAKLSKIQSSIEKLRSQETQRDNLVKEIVLLHCSYIKKADDLLERLYLNAGGLEIKANKACKSKGIKQFLSDRMFQQSEEQKEYVASFSDAYERDTNSKIQDYVSKAVQGNLKYKNNNSNQNTVTEFLSTNWFEITYDLKYQNDSFKSMSPGKQAFVILKLLLEFSDRKSPILIDQPEDSLDNRAIFTELVAYLRKKKKDRQIILVTHNPNVVVGSDSEEVIVANQHGDNSKNINEIKFAYISGSLENTIPHNAGCTTTLEAQGIREHVCEILEGGKDAFEKREMKYGLKG